MKPHPLGVPLVIALGTAALSLLSFEPALAAEKPAEKVYKNIKALKGMPAGELDGAMRFMAASLGVGCDFCHVTSEKGHWPMEKDDKEEKGTAREMIQMTKAINHAHFQDHAQVTCATCHHGRNEPLRQPPLAKTSDEDALLKKDAALPGVDDVAAKYLTAVGGKDAVDKLTTREVKATIETADGRTMRLEMQAKAPDKLVSHLTLPNGVAERGFNGKEGWMRNPDGSAGELKSLELAQTKRMASFTGELKFKEHYSKTRMVGVVKVGDREAYLVDARDGGGQRERLYFDTQTGLLDRVVAFTHTYLGDLPERIDYDDYREVDGIKFPYTVRRMSSGMELVTKVSEVKHNVPLEDKVFEPPVPAPKP